MTAPVPMTEERLAEIEARANAATRGPWRACGKNEPCACGLVWAIPADEVVAEVVRKNDESGGEWTPEKVAAHMKFIAAAREDVPALVAEVRRLRGLAPAFCSCGDAITEPGGKCWNCAAELEREATNRAT